MNMMARRVVLSVLYISVGYSISGVYTLSLRFRP